MKSHAALLHPARIDSCLCPRDPCGMHYLPISHSHILVVRSTGGITVLVFNWPVTYSMVAPKHKSGDAGNSDLIRIPFTEFIWQYSNDSISLSIANLLLNLI